VAAVILDTNAVSALLAGDRALGTVLARRAKHELPVVVIGEYRFGLARSKSRGRIEPLFDRLVGESIVLDVSLETASVYARVRARLLTEGHPIPENDVWIAALAVEHDLPIVSRDTDFDYVADVQRIPW